MAGAIGFPSGPYFSKAYALILYQTSFARSFALYLLARHRQYQAKYLDYRALSETARVGVFWKIARVRKVITAVFPICQPLELAWVRLSLNLLEFVGRGSTRGCALPRLSRCLGSRTIRIFSRQRQTAYGEGK
jgi:hypothetical protein